MGRRQSGVQRAAVMLYNGGSQPGPPLRSRPLSEVKDAGHARDPVRRRSGNATRCSPRTRRRCSTSTGTWSTRSPAPRHSTACGSPGGKVRRPDLTFATLDHNVPTENQLDIREPMSRRQVETLRANCREFGVTLYDMGSGHQGIVHVIGPELGLTLPGTDHRLRRQPHEHPRRLRRPGLRHRHERGRARPGDPDPLARAVGPSRSASR